MAKGNFYKRLRLEGSWPFAPICKHHPSSHRNNMKLRARQERRKLNRRVKDEAESG